MQALSDTDIHIYEAVASLAIDAHRATLEEVTESSGLDEQQVRRSLATLVANGHILPRGDGFVLGAHDFGVDY
ncbi:hypothetical protein [Nonomuraea typhae]|uniref:hypothetical protein n=1 Tax=Nonomuraea typhae TaxID=2603600 RepID=UPI0012F8003A|nr:hypothetical protein [Nonomuraea typhae]